MDVVSIEPDETAAIKIDALREALAATAFRPFEGRRRAVILRHADAMTVAAQNALLKSLEEPPPTTVFLLTSSVPGVLLPTVRSRCIRLRFGRLSERDVESVLTRDFGLSSRDARTAAALTDGSVGRALALSSTDLTELRDLAVRLLRQSASSPAATRLQAAAALAAGPSKKDRAREDVALVLRLVASMLRDIELLNTTGDERGLANPVVGDDLHAVRRAFAGSRARDAFGAVDRALAALERNVGTKVVSDWLALQL